MGDIEIEFDVVAGKRTPRDIKDAIELGVRSALPKIAKSAITVSKAKVKQEGAIFTGELYESFRWGVFERNDKIRLKIWNDADHAAAIEVGAEYGDEGPPVEKLIPWVRAKLSHWKIEEGGLIAAPWQAQGRELTLEESEPAGDYSGIYSFVNISLDERNEVKDAVDHAASRGDISRLTQVRDKNPPDDYGDSIATASWFENLNGDFTKSEIWLNPDEVDNTKLEEYNNQGYLAGDQIKHTVYHESIHAMHYEIMDEYGEIGLNEWPAFMTRKKLERIEDEISTYAATSPVEFVAEAGALLMDDKTIPSDLFELYKRFRGPDVT